MENLTKAHGLPATMADSQQKSEFLTTKLHWLQKKRHFKKGYSTYVTQRQVCCKGCEILSQITRKIADSKNILGC